MTPNRAKVIIITILVIAFSTFAYNKIDRFFEIDSCLDHGGSWNYQTVKCEFEEEIFNNFFVKFTTDSLFQKERVQFPFLVKSRDIDNKLTVDKIEKGEWKFLTFEYNDEYEKRAIDAYTQETKMYRDSVKIELRGVDNGIHIDFELYKEHGKWFLVSEKDLSN